MSVNGQVAAQQAMARTLPFAVPGDETFDIGRDTGSSVDDRDDQVPCAFTGTLRNLTISLGAMTVEEVGARN